MRTIDITKDKQNLIQLVDDVNVSFNSLKIVNNNAEKAFLISKETKNSEEILYLSSIPGFIEDINNIRKTENWKSAKEFDYYEEW